MIPPQVKAYSETKHQHSSSAERDVPLRGNQATETEHWYGLQLRNEFHGERLIEKEIAGSCRKRKKQLGV